MSPETLEQVAADHARALSIAARAGDRRARLAFEAREAGLSLGAIARALGMARPNVVTLVRRGAELPASAGRPDRSLAPPRVPRRDGPSAASGHRDATVPRRLGLPEVVVPATATATGAVPCLREGCPFPRADGHRFCAGHVWS